jgi:hypothetical protein
MSITDVISLKRRGIVGTTKITDFVEKERIIYRSSVVSFEGGVDITFSEKAKVLLLELAEEFGIKRFRNLNSNNTLIGNYAGFYAKTGKYHGCYAYVDIKSFYYNIYKRFILLQYRRGHFLSDAVKDVFHFFQERESQISKKEKVSMFGIMRSTERTSYKTQKGKVVLDRKRTYHNLLNTDLALLTYDLSRMICYFAIRNFDAVYYNVDGAILPCCKTEDFRNFLFSLGFDCSIKDINQSGCIIKGVGIYKVEKATLNYPHVQLTENKITTNISIRDEDKDFYFWLLKKYQEKHRF